MTDKDKASPTTTLTANQNTAAWVLIQGQQIIPAGVKFIRFIAEVDTTGAATVARFDDVFFRIAFGKSTVLNPQGSVIPTPITSMAAIWTRAATRRVTCGP